MKILNSYIIFLFLFFVLSHSNSLGQQTCPPDLNQFPSSITATFEPWPNHFWGSVDFQYRQNGSRYEIKVDWSSLANNGYYGLTNDELKQMMYKAVIKTIIGSNCTFQGTKEFVFFEETQCKKWKYCYLHFVTNQTFYCADNGWPGPNPDIFEYNNEKYCKLASIFNCGTQCCEYVYTVECIDDHTYGVYPHIVSISKNPYPNSTCPSSQDTDCLTGQPEPCNSTCD
jgi:hypothetical protein